MEIRYFYSSRSKDRAFWNDTYKLFQDKGIELHLEPKECDVSVVLGGCLVNPIPLKGKKILAFKADEWKVVKWNAIFKPILEEYYDYFIDTTGLNPEQTVELIEQSCENL